jgi:cytosine deaminase
VEIEVVQSDACLALMRRFIRESPKIWNEDIGEP